MAHPEELRISRRDWAHGLVTCPTCGLPLEKDRDHAEFLWQDVDRKAYGVEGTLTRCGMSFRLYFDDIGLIPSRRPDRSAR